MRRQGLYVNRYIARLIRNFGTNDLHPHLRGRTSRRDAGIESTKWQYDQFHFELIVGKEGHRIGSSLGLLGLSSIEGWRLQKGAAYTV